MEYSTDALKTQPWNIPPWNVPQLRFKRNRGIFHHGMFHSCALNATVEYSTVERSTVARWNQVRGVLAVVAVEVVRRGDVPRQGAAAAETFSTPAALGTEHQHRYQTSL